MTDTSSRSRIPEDIIVSIFDILPLSVLLRAMVVSRQWHELVISHQTYWRSLSFEEGKDCQRLFLARISRASNRPIEVKVTLQGHGLEPIVNALQENLHHMIRLDLHVGPLWVDRVLTVLQQPAPILVALCIYIISPSSPIIPFWPPVDFLGSNAPVLKDLSLRNITPGQATIFHSRTKAHGFSHHPTVTSLQICSDSLPASPLTAELIHSVVRSFPALTHVNMTGFSSLALWPAEWDLLSTLVVDLYSAEADEAVLTFPQVAAIPFLTVWPTSTRVGELVMSHFARDASIRLIARRYKGPHLRRSGEDCVNGRSIVLVGKPARADVQSDIQRTVHFTPIGPRATLRMIPRIANFFDAGNLIYRITALVMDNNIWRPMALIFWRLPVLEEATLVLSSPEPKMTALTATAPIECPVLRKLTIRNDLGWHLGEGISRARFDDLEEFVRTAFRETSLPIVLKLDNLIVSPMNVESGVLELASDCI